MSKAMPIGDRTVQCVLSEEENEKLEFILQQTELTREEVVGVLLDRWMRSYLIEMMDFPIEKYDFSTNPPKLRHPGDCESD